MDHDKKFASAGELSLILAKYPRSETAGMTMENEFGSLSKKPSTTLCAAE